MVGTYSVVLQSPSFDGTGGNGEQLPLPSIQWSNSGTSNSTTLALPGKNNVTFNFGKLQEQESIQGLFTDSNMQGENWRYDASAGAWETYKDAIHARDILLRARKQWPGESASGDWGSAGLPSEEQDSGTDRAEGKVRLILDKTYLSDHYEGTIPSRGSSLSLQYAFVYGNLSAYSEKHVGPSHRYRIPYQVDFEPTKIQFTIA